MFAPPSVSGTVIRPSTAADVEAITRIYAWHVLNGTGTFEIEPPDRLEIERRRADVLAKGWPWLVLESAGAVAGYAYAGPFRPRPGYRFTAEDSVYVAPDAAGQGVGRAVLTRVVEACEAFGLRQLVAVIGDSGNAASINLHRSLGFEHSGVGRSFGFKHRRWVDIVWMQKSLNGGDERAPDTSGITLSGN